MRKLLCAVLMLLALLSLEPCACADYDPEADYLSIMCRAAMCGDIEAGRAAEICRNESIRTQGLDETEISFDELYLLSKVLFIEAGSPKISDEWRMCIGEVVMNRVLSPEFPDTVREVIFQEGQYAGVGTPEFEYLITPTQDCVSAALRLLEGERVMEPSVVFQANFPQGGGIYKSFYSDDFGFTYLCVSTRPELYV